MNRQSHRVCVERALSNAMASRYDRLVAPYEWMFRDVIERATERLDQRDRVLEIGCGTGIVSLGIAPSVAAVVGVDLAPKMIAIARRKAQSLAIPNVELHVADGYGLPFEDTSFDAVVLSNVLHLVREPRELLAQAMRLLKSQGWLITLTDCYSEPIRPLALRLQVRGYSVLKALGITYLNRFRQCDIPVLLAESGCEAIEGVVVNPAPVGFFAVGRKAGLERTP